jgi:hypothetical protein
VAWVGRWLKALARCAPPGLLTRSGEGGAPRQAAACRGSACRRWDAASHGREQGDFMTAGKVVLSRTPGCDSR